MVSRHNQRLLPRHPGGEEAPYQSDGCWIPGVPLTVQRKNGNRASWASIGDSFLRLFFFFFLRFTSSPLSADLLPQERIRWFSAARL